MNNPYNYLTEKDMSKYDRVIAELDSIYRAQRFGDAYWGTEGIKTTIEHYNYILAILDKIPELSEKEKIELRRIISEKIASVPEVEKEKDEEEREYRDKQKAAFESAKLNFSKRFIFYRAMAKIKSIDPKSVEKTSRYMGRYIYDMKISEIENLYKRK